ncbi:hypothetical protein IGB42_01922 [Andreprevotia sp. IGB-42]|uniref:hypothetical protein n=1 Tax=Andreprevotia sp. IGB-42 TaxID=2497473 RepID=UPI00135BABBA|nr:hypothetical protein [Andreprevotia sp. IGB-42]KAF0813571.1 hypothetical protein IGB42_01922 [Andreprevotia sp. IGB-42]
MNYLQLVQQTWREAGLSGEGPPDVVSATDMARKVCSWVNQAWQEIQSLRAWPFLQRRVSAQLIPSQYQYTLAELGLADVRSFDVRYLQIGAQPARWLDWPAARGVWDKTPDAGKPAGVSLHPSGALWFDRVPDQPYGVQLDYTATAQNLQDNLDVPALQEQDQMVIVWLAVSRYAGYDVAPELLAAATQNYRNAMMRLLQHSFATGVCEAPLA